MTSIKALTCFCRTFLHNSFSKTLFPNHNSYYNSPRRSNTENKALYFGTHIFQRRLFHFRKLFFFEIEPLITAWPAFNKSKQIKEGLGSFHPLNLEQYFEIMGWTSFRVNVRESKYSPSHWFRIPATGLRIVCQWNWESGSQSLVGFWNCIPDSKAQHSGF